MVSAKLMTVEVAYANALSQRIISLEVKEGSSIEQVIQLSGILQVFPEIDLKKQKVGIFSQLKALSDPLKSGDRVEIYRELLIDPKEARRGRAKRG